MKLTKLEELNQEFKYDFMHDWYFVRDGYLYAASESPHNGDISHYKLRKAKKDEKEGSHYE